MINLDRVSLGEKNINSINIDSSKRETKENEQKMYSSDTFEKSEPLTEDICECYSNYSVKIGLPKSIFGNRFAYNMEDEMFKFIAAYYAGEKTREEVSDYFEECCSSMRTYCVQQCYTSGKNSEDNKKIISMVYAKFQEKNAIAAKNANYIEGKEINSSYGGSSNDWVYYNSDYYYKCEEIRSDLQTTINKITEKWEINPINIKDVEEDPTNKFSLGFNFNSVWNHTFKSSFGNACITNKSSVPPKNLKIFYKEVISSPEDYENANGILKILVDKEEYILKKSFCSFNSSTPLENIGELLQIYFSENKITSEAMRFFRSLSIFSRGYGDRYMR